MAKETLRKHIGNIVCKKTGKTYLKVYQIVNGDEANKTNEHNKQK